MEAFNTYCAIIGVVAVGMGIYMLFTKQLIGRSTGSANKETILKFLPIEVATYVLEGILLMMMGLPQYFPFAEKSPGSYILIAISLIIVVINVILGKKYFPDAKPPEKKNLGPRLK